MLKQLGSCVKNKQTTLVIPVQALGIFHHTAPWQLFCSQMLFFSQRWVFTLCCTG